MSTASDAVPVTRLKRERTAKAIAALCGWSMWATVDDYGRRAFLLKRGAITRELPSVDAVESFLEEFAR